MGRQNALVLAAGIGSRLKPLTDEWPKCLMPIHGVPLLEYWLSDLIALASNQIFVNTFHHAEIVEEFLQRDRFRGHVTAVPETQLLGTAGTLMHLASQLLDKPTLLIHGDNWCYSDLEQLVKYHYDKRPAYCPMTMMTFTTDNPQSCGIVKLDEENIVSAFYEKCPDPPGTTANAAVYMMEPEIIQWITKQEGCTDFTLDVIPRYIGQIATIHNHSFYRDIGNIRALRLAQNDPQKQTIWNNPDLWLQNFSNHPIHRQILLSSQ